MLRGATGAHQAGPHFAPRAKHKIVLFMPGGPSQMDMFDPKPALAKYAGQRPPSVDLRTERATGGLLPSPFEFNSTAGNGLEVSELLPKLGEVIDDMCVLRSVHTFNPTHTPARSLMHSGNIAADRPSMGAWLSYGLGTENANLPGFVVLPAAAERHVVAVRLSAGQHQGTQIRRWRPPGEDDPVPAQLPTSTPRPSARQLDLMQALNRRHADSLRRRRVSRSPHPGDGDGVPHADRGQRAFDLQDEPARVREEYGTTEFANGCLLARRCVERGVRSVFVYYGAGQPWDDHTEHQQEPARPLPRHRPGLGGAAHRPEAARAAGRHAGGVGRRVRPHAGVRERRRPRPQPLRLHDVDGRRRRERRHRLRRDRRIRVPRGGERVSIHDLHATMLHLLGLDHEKLTYRYAGRDFRLTDVRGRSGEGDLELG